MYRNLSKRVEIVTPILAEEAKEKLWKILDVVLRDRRQAWILDQDGECSTISGGIGDRPRKAGYT